ncbi:hypothetical protein PUN28_017276 [Cardiocondyla obscurior]|uniref:Uncharacterized protein n=1 Tax=Cardiocondyla obscurior TaxID=286306 RepID=A0AAW2EQ08_9HYME
MKELLCTLELNLIAVLFDLDCETLDDILKQAALLIVPLPIRLNRRKNISKFIAFIIALYPHKQVLTRNIKLNICSKHKINVLFILLQI